MLLFFCGYSYAKLYFFGKQVGLAEKEQYIND
jgi:hypothetical protein